MIHNFTLQVFCNPPVLGCVHADLPTPVYTTVLMYGHFSLAFLQRNLGKIWSNVVKSSSAHVFASLGERCILVTTV